MTELAIKGDPQPLAEGRLIPIRDVAKVFPGRCNQWVVRNILERGLVDCIKVNRAWYVYEDSFRKFLATNTKKTEK